MKRWLPVAALILVLLLSACATVKPQDDSARLRAELKKWENFSFDGIVQVNYTGFSLRKMFVISKTQTEARFDIIDGGVMGLNPKPLVSAYIGDYLAVESPYFPQLEKLMRSSKVSPLSLKSLANTDSLLALYQDTIIRERKLSLANTELLFSPNLQLEKITDLKSKAEVAITYTSKGDPDKVMIRLDDKTSLELMVDRISYGKAEVVPLPPPEPDPFLEDFMQMLESLIPVPEEP